MELRCFLQEVWSTANSHLWLPCITPAPPVQGVGDVLTDWRITAQPPLTLRNDLPVAAHYVLWERPARGGSLVLRQQGKLEGWSSINVYSVDLRQQVRVAPGERVTCTAFLWVVFKPICQGPCCGQL